MLSSPPWHHKRHNPAAAALLTSCRQLPQPLLPAVAAVDAACDRNNTTHMIPSSKQAGALVVAHGLRRSPEKCSVQTVPLHKLSGRLMQQCLQSSAALTVVHHHDADRQVVPAQIQMTHHKRVTQPCGVSPRSCAAPLREQSSAAQCTGRHAAKTLPGQCDEQANTPVRVSHLQIVSHSMPLKPKALSPSTATTFLQAGRQAGRVAGRVGGTVAANRARSNCCRLTATHCPALHPC